MNSSAPSRAPRTWCWSHGCWAVSPWHAINATRKCSCLAHPTSDFTQSSSHFATLPPLLGTKIFHNSHCLQDEVRMPQIDHRSSMLKAINVVRSLNTHWVYTIVNKPCIYLQILSSGPTYQSTTTGYLLYLFFCSSCLLNTYYNTCHLVSNYLNGKDNKKGG